MMFPKNWEKFIEDYSFKDKEEVYTNGSVLVPVFRVEQMVEHYFNNAWIPVSERLPEHGVIALCRLTFNELRILQWDSVSKWWLGYGAGDDWRQKDVTHWMPLPNPPKEDN
jgi:hypothetical protein